MPGKPDAGAIRTPTPEQLGRALADRRRAAGLIQAELAEWAGVSGQYVGLLENGDVSQQVRRLMDLLGTLGCDLAVVPRRGGA